MSTLEPIRSIADRVMPKPARRELMRWARRLTLHPRVGAVQFGDLRRLTPISDDWGFDRGEPIDRFYIRRFMEQHTGDVRGRVLEIGNNDLTRLYGGQRVSHSDVLHVADTGPPVTIVADLSEGNGIPSDAFDCVILTQTLQLIYDTGAVVRTLHRILKAGGVALVTVPGITRISRYDMDRWGQYWSFTTRSARRLFEQAFAPAEVDVEAQGNVCAAVAFLQGVAAEELSNDELLHRDPNFETLITIRARKELR